jgi:hypothetical protein
MVTHGAPTTLLCHNYTDVSSVLFKPLNYMQICIVNKSGIRLRLRGRNIHRRALTCGKSTFSLPPGKRAAAACSARDRGYVGYVGYAQIGGWGPVDDGVRQMMHAMAISCML